MNKNELIKGVATKTQLSQKEVKLTLEAIGDLIKESLKNGESVKLTNFGKFDVKYRNKRVTINPRTKQKMVIPSTKVASFKVGKELKTAVGE